jgi:hypothetical protein
MTVPLLSSTHSPQRSGLSQGIEPQSKKFKSPVKAISSRRSQGSSNLNEDVERQSVSISNVKAFSQSLDEKHFPDYHPAHPSLRDDVSGSFPGCSINRGLEIETNLVKCVGRFCMRIDHNWSCADREHVDSWKAAFSIGWVFGTITICSFLFLAAPLSLDAGPEENNWWIYAFMQQFFWTLHEVALFEFVFNASLPGLRLRWRIVIHILGVLTYCGYRILFHGLKMDDNQSVNTFAILISLPMLSICYLF